MNGDDMSSESYYVRSRGKVTGPFDLSSVQKLVKRGMVSRIHEISSDRVSWTGAGEYEELFPSGGSLATATASPGAVTTDEGTYDIAGDAATGPTMPDGLVAAARPSGDQYFYSQRG